MQIIENKKIKEKVYIETLENGMKIIVVPKKNTEKKYVIWGTKFGSIDNHFIDPTTNAEVKVPDGVAHYLEHKMFEQADGTDSLFTMMSLGLDANAYTTNDHTAYLFGGTEHFYEGLDELMDYVQHPYYTDKTVEKERTIIGQEIGKYDDEPFWKLYINAMDCLYKNNPIKLDIAGTVESISHITKETLYSCYNTFYHPSNMIMCISGDFEPAEIIEEVKKRLLPREKMGEIKRIYPSEPIEINHKYKEDKMDVNMPIFMIGYKDNLSEDKVKEQIAIEIIFNSLLGKCSKAYQELYTKGLLMTELGLEDEYSTEYSHVLISGESEDPEEVCNIIKNILENEDVSQNDFERSKKRIYGEFVEEFNDGEEIGRIFLQDSIKGINTIEYIDKYEKIDLEYVNKIKKELFNEKSQILSIIKNK
jgi:predicted Zn-dependent peptidase